MVCTRSNAHLEDNEPHQENNTRLEARMIELQTTMQTLALRMENVENQLKGPNLNQAKGILDNPHEENLERHQYIPSTRRPHGEGTSRQPRNQSRRESEQEWERELNRTELNHETEYLARNHARNTSHSDTGLEEIHERGNQYRARDEDEALRSLRMNPPIFEGTNDTQGYLDWQTLIEQYFECYAVPEKSKVKCAKFLLRGSAQLYWGNIERQMERRGLEPINSWAMMKLKLNEKYVSPHYRQRNYNQLSRLIQGNDTVPDYMNKLDNLLIKSDLNEEPWVTVSRFKGGLRPEIRRALMYHPTDNIHDAYQLACEIEYEMKQSKYFQPISKNPINSKAPGPSGNNSNLNTPSVPTAPKPASIPNKVTCFKCSQPGHLARDCKKKALLITEENVETEPELEEPEEDVYAPEYNSEEDLVNPIMAVVRCSILKEIPTEDWKRTSLFYTYTKCNEKVCKIVIDSGSSLNVISKTAATKFALTLENHPKPYNISWVDQTHVPVTHRCCVPLKLSSYSGHVWCDVANMDVADILLGRPWLYDLDVTHRGRSNTYEFMHNGKKVTLLPSLPREIRTSHSKGKAIERTKTVSLLQAQPFIKESKETGIIYSLVCKPTDQASVSETPPEVLRLLEGYKEITPEELPEDLPPERSIQHAIDLVPGATLPHLPHYRMSPTEHEELRRQVDELLNKEFIRDSLSPCAVPALLM